jgi:hypothetical protein
MQAPFFFQGERGDAVAEYREFLDAVEDAALHLLAEFTNFQAHGTLADIRREDDAATKVRGLYCRHVEGWVVFYTAAQAGVGCQIEIILVGSLNPHSFEALENEAEARLRDRA